jgi:hypothetical protein
MRKCGQTMRFFSAAAILSFAAAGFMPAESQAAVVLSDLNGVASSFDYNSFTGNTVSGPTSTFFSVVTPANQFGGVGFNISPINLTGEPLLEVSARIGSGNANSDFNVLLQDADGTLVGYSFSASSFNTSTFTTATRPIATPDFTLNTGTTPGLDVSNITQFQFQGDFSGSALVPFAFDFDNIAAVPEPATLGVLAVCAVVLGLRRTRKGARQ